MQIPDWMITEEMKHMEHYRMYAEVFGLDVPLTQSQPTDSIQGTHKTPSAPRSPTPKKDIAESSAPKRSTVICFRLPERRSTRLTPPVPVPTLEKADKMILQDTLQVSLAEHKSREEQEARENVELVNKHLVSEEIEILVEGSENVIDDKVERTNAEEVEVTNVVIPVNVNEEEDEITDEVDQVPVYIAEGLIMERQKTKEEMEQMIAKAILQERGNIQAEISSQNQKAIDHYIPSQVDASMKFENLQVPQTTCRPFVVRPRDQDDPHDDVHPEGENSVKRQKTFEYEAYMSGESSSERGPSTSGNQEQEDDYNFWTDSYASDDDEIPIKQVSQDIMEEV
ncbi:hypothetical protein Tco_1513861, partial [Tanacetum coccineum]